MIMVKFYSEFYHNHNFLTELQIRIRNLENFKLFLIDFLEKIKTFNVYIENEEISMNYIENNNIILNIRSQNIDKENKIIFDTLNIKKTNIFEINYNGYNMYKILNVLEIVINDINKKKIFTIKIIVIRMKMIIN